MLKRVSLLIYKTVWECPPAVKSSGLRHSLLLHTFFALAVENPHDSPQLLPLDGKAKKLFTPGTWANDRFREAAQAATRMTGEIRLLQNEDGQFFQNGIQLYRPSCRHCVMIFSIGYRLDGTPMSNLSWSTF